MISTLSLSLPVVGISAASMPQSVAPSNAPIIHTTAHILKSTIALTCGCFGVAHRGGGNPETALGVIHCNNNIVPNDGQLE
jgi:hypothetical protein